jgi:hypothetical protein
MHQFHSVVMRLENLDGRTSIIDTLRLLVTWLAHSGDRALLSMFVGGNGRWGRFLFTPRSIQLPRLPHETTSVRRIMFGPEKILSNTPRNEEPTPWPINQILPMTCNRNIGSF